MAHRSNIQVWKAQEKKKNRNVPAIEFLRSCRRSSQRITQLVEEEYRWRYYGQRLTASYSSNPSHGGGGVSSGVEASVDKIDDILEMIQTVLSKIVEQRRVLELLLDSIDDTRLHEVLRWRYCTDLSWYDICEKMGYERRHLNRLNSMAVEAVQFALDTDSGLQKQVNDVYSMDCAVKSGDDTQ